MKDQNLIHVKIDSEEAIKLKREILSSEISLLKIMRHLKSFHSLRSFELDLKENLNDQTKAVKLDINNVKRILPKLKVPSIIKEDKKDIVKKTIQKPKITPEMTIEDELAEIQGRLARL